MLKDDRRTTNAQSVGFQNRIVTKISSLSQFYVCYKLIREKNGEGDQAAMVDMTCHLA